MTDFRTIYLKSKSGISPPNDEINAVRAMIFGPSSAISYYAILSFGLNEVGNEKNLRRLQELAEIYYYEREDDLLKACLTSGVIYFSFAEYFVDVSMKILDEIEVSAFEDSQFVAGTCISKHAKDKRSTEMLSYLVLCAKKSLENGDLIRCESLVRSALQAATGEKGLTNSEVKPFFDCHKLNLIKFDMKL
ncbi:hypothetical protein ACQU0X_13570 [Pseudovibrio ascidiaceicola]|uniref:hypothetical protein n=1 Tax=Pseudovibrio ascidiaceicola TaxID=285279 RepID=UPI003D360B8F